MQLDLFETTASAALGARSAVAHLARTTSIDEPRMAKIAQAAIFQEALMNALHSRLNELRSVVK